MAWKRSRVRIPSGPPTLARSWLGHIWATSFLARLTVLLRVCFLAGRTSSAVGAFPAREYRYACQGSRGGLMGFERSGTTYLSLPTDVLSAKLASRSRD